MNAAYDIFLNRLKENKKVKIYGAGKFAKTLGLFCGKNGVEVEAFIVSKKEENTEQLIGKPVIEMSSLKKDELSDIVVGFENRTMTYEVVDELLNRNVPNIIMVRNDIVNDIYCNFVIDEYSLEQFCEQLKKETQTIIYANDDAGEVIGEYLMKKGIQIEAFYTDNMALKKNSNRIFLTEADLKETDLNTTIILASNNISWQRAMVTKLRKHGFERIVLISDEIREELLKNYHNALWEEGNTEFKVLESKYIEKNHYIVETHQDDHIYHFRVAKKNMQRLKENLWQKIRESNLLEEFCSQYSGCRYIPYKKDELSQLETPECKLEVYMSKFHKDKQIQKAEMPDWVIPIQVGKALTDIKIADICDNVGDNISHKNVDYSEGTALYWLWKNTAGQDYIGLFHYRRQMVMDKESLNQILQQDITLTIPTYMPEGNKAFFVESFLLKHDWDLMMQYIKEYDEAYYETALEYENKHFYFPCNIFIMKRKYFDEACSLIFGVLEKVDAYYNERQLLRKDRYLGYLVENLLSIYVMHNASRLKIACTDMKFVPLIENV